MEGDLAHFDSTSIRPSCSIQPWKAAFCTQGGIGRVAALGVWSHPLSIVGYILRGQILPVTVSFFTGLKLPLIQGDQQAMLAVAILAGLKVFNTLLHTVLSR